MIIKNKFKKKDLDNDRELLMSEYLRLQEELKIADKEHKNEIEKNLDSLRNEIIKIDTVKSEDFRGKLGEGVKIFTFATGLLFAIWGTKKSFEFDGMGTLTSTEGRKFLDKLIWFGK